MRLASKEQLLSFSQMKFKSGGADYETSLTKKVMSAYQFYEGYPDFHRSPRIIYRSSEDKITVNAPGNEPNKSKDELLKLIVPPLVMIGVSILISIFRPRGIYIIATMSMALVTMIFSITGYFKNRKQYKQDLQERIDSYHDYLSDKSIELQKLAKEQKRGQHYHYPTIEGLQEMADTYHHRIYEKTPLHFDFLYYRLGLGEVPTSYNIHYSQPERSGKKDPLENEGYNLYFNNRYIKNMPIVANLSHGPVGYIGPRGLVLEQLQLMVNQLAFFHSYHDVQFITIVPEEEMDKWSWMRWLPHETLQDVNVRGFVYNQRSRDQVLNSLNQILKLRRTQREDKSAKEGTLFSPHYVVIVTDEKLILDHVIMEFFTEDPTELGCSLIFVQDVMSSLSENIKTIINIKDRNTGQLVIEEGELKETDFELDHFLILATQKPSGVVDDQIWSNSRFKLALKVADRGDSMEMLHTPDAAEITQAGRAYLQVGNNEVYELFQSAWSGADYQPEKDDQGIEDHTIYSINDLGQYEILNDDLSGLDQAENIKEVPTELDAIVENIQALTKEMGISDLPQPWLPPLSNQIAVTDLRKEGSVDLWSKAPSYKAVLGFMDIPSQQAQEVAYHDFEDDGHLSIFAGPSMGKSTALQTVTMDLARHNSPEFLNLYLFDFGTNGLLPLRRLPHVADFFTIDDDEKIAKFIARIKVEMSDRKKALSRYNVATAKLYRQVSGETMPQILIVIDSYEGLREAQTPTNLEACFQNISRDGSSLGISLVISAGRTAALRSSLMANLKERIALKLTDDSESRTLVGRHQHIMEDIPGRGLIKRDDIEVLQVALSTEGTETFDIINNIQNESDAMNSKWTGPRPKAIPIVPEELTFDDFMATDSVQADLSANRLPFGLEMVDVESYSLALNRFKHMLYMSDSDESLEAVGSHIIKVLLNVPNYHNMIIDSLGEYESYQGQVRTYVGSDMIEDMADQLIYELQQRESQSEIAEWFIMIPDFESFVAKSNMKLEQVQALLDNGPRYGLHLILGSSYNYVGTKIDAVPKYVRTTTQYVLAGMRLMDQTFLEKVYNSKEIRPNKDEAYIHDRKTYQKLKLTID